MVKSGCGGHDDRARTRETEQILEMNLVHRCLPRHEQESAPLLERDVRGARQETVSDGTNEVQAIASRTRLEDLAPGRQTVGVNWSMAVAFHSRSEKEHITFDRRMMGALADSYIGTPLRLRYRQDAALGLIMPITRAGTKTRIERMTEWVGL